MARFLNPDNSAFQVALNSKIYVDKTMLLNYTNTVIDTNDCFICNSRPRRFGKSITANMLVAYYSKGCNSEKMFEGKEISRSDSFKKHLNQYDVIHFDVQWCCMDAGSAKETIGYITRNIIEELKLDYPKVITEDIKTLYGALSCIHAVTNKRFIIIIDEWDIFIRDNVEDIAVQEEYINFLRGLFKGTEPTKFLHLVYLTGILPIKKLKTQSALNNFEEFTMLDAGELAFYMGFTEQEVKKLCKQYQCDFCELRRWYDGYVLENEHIYNPKAVVSVITKKKFKSYWSMTGTYESILPLINRDFDGLKTEIIKMISGAAVEVDVNSFQNDMISFTNKDDILTVLIHLGYLAFDEKNQTAFIPNEEIRSEFIKVTKRKRWNEFIDFEQKSKKLLDATLNENESIVAEIISEIHMDYASIIQYHDENSLSSVLAIAYLSTLQYYFKPIRELPTGRGFADFVFIPKVDYIEYPALVVELKWNQTARTAICQIKDKCYTKALENYTGDILLIGINYNKKNSKHECLIEKFKK